MPDTEPPFLLWPLHGALAALAAWGLVQSPAGPGSAGAAGAVAIALGVVALGILLLPDRPGALAPALAQGLVTLMTLSLLGHPLPPAVGLALGSAILGFAAAAAISFLEALGSTPVEARAQVLSVGLVATTLPLWSGPSILFLDTGPGVVNALLAMDPLSLLAGLGGWDFLHHDWWYRHSPFGSWRYQYPEWPTAALLWIGLGAALMAWRRVLSRGRTLHEDVPTNDHGARRATQEHGGSPRPLIVPSPHPSPRERGRVGAPAARFPH